MIKKSLALILFLISSAYADTITVDNQSDFPLYGATYSGRKTFTRLSVVTPIGAQSQTTFERPSFTFDLDSRYLVISVQANDLKQTLTQDEFLILPSQDLSPLRGSTFYIDFYQNKFELFNQYNWRLYQPIRRKIISPLAATLATLKNKTVRSLFETPKSRSLLGTFDQTVSLTDQEKDFLARRKPRITKALTQLLGKNGAPKQPLSVAVCCSGGGMRAALATAGFFAGLEKTKLIDCITYASTLSGSTWMLNGWMSRDVTASAYKEILIKQSQQSLIGSPYSRTQLNKHLLTKLVFGHPLSIVDIYGAGLGGIFFDKPFETVLSDQAKRVKSGSVPLPIYTAILTKQPYQTVEFTPFSVGADYLGGYIQPWAFGQEFIKGVSTQRSPEEPLGFLLGIYGYAIGVNFSELLTYVEKDLKPDFLVTILKKSLNQTDLGRQRLFPAQVLNFTFGFPELPRGQQETLTLIDAGILFNLPLQTLFEKKGRFADVVIVFDSSDYASDEIIGQEFEKAIAYLQSKNIPMPKIDSQSLRSSLCSVFFDENNATMPLIIYMPLAKAGRGVSASRITCLESGDCSTFKFGYKPEVARAVADTAQANTINSRQTIIDALRKKAQQKNKALNVSIN